jgi:hypothetical protein
MRESWVRSRAFVDAFEDQHDADGVAGFEQRAIQEQEDGYRLTSSGTEGARPAVRQTDCLIIPLSPFSRKTRYKSLGIDQRNYQN